MMTLTLSISALPSSALDGYLMLKTAASLPSVHSLFQILGNRKENAKGITDIYLAILPLLSWV